MGRASVLGAVLSVVLAPADLVEAGGESAVPPVRVVAPSSAAGIKLERDDLPVPVPEVQKRPVKVDTPPVPSFELPPAESGFRSARELRARGTRLLGTPVKIRGYVTWVYDCPSVLASANPAATRAAIQAAIRNDPTLCERPMFSLGDSRDTPRDLSILVVDPKGAPRLVVGSYLMTSGIWATPPQADASDGALLHGTVETAVPVPASPAGEPATGLKDLEIDLDVETPAMRRFVDDPTLNASVDHLNACNKALAAKQYDDAIKECRTATEIWQDNHLAWYAWASAHMAKREWSQAKELVENAVTLRPDQAMYQLYYGISLYEAERRHLRDEQARKDHKKPEDVEIDPAALKLDAPRDALAAAIRRVPDLWRAHYYLGRIHRDLDDARRAAQRFTTTIKTHPGFRFGYIALSELYRRWDYLDQALAVALLGTNHVPAAEAGELWFEVAMAYDAKQSADKAIEAFGKAIASKPDDAVSKFQRGRLYLHKGDLASARRDLEDVTRSRDPRLGTAKQLAAQLLAQVANKSSHEPRGDCRRRGNAIVCRPLLTQSARWTKVFRLHRPE